MAHCLGYSILEAQLVYDRSAAAPLLPERTASGPTDPRRKLLASSVASPDGNDAWTVSIGFHRQEVPMSDSV